MRPGTINRLFPNATSPAASETTLNKRTVKSHTCHLERTWERDRDMGRQNASAEFLRTTRLSVRVARNDFADVVIVHRKLQTSARFQLPNLLPVKLLPGGVVVDLERSKTSSAFRDLGIAQ